MASGKKYTYNEVLNLINNLGYKLLSNEYINARTYLSIQDKNDYKYYSTLGNLLCGKIPYFSDSRNPYFIDNIKNYICKNEIDVELISDQYNKYLQFRCKCGNIFKCTTDKFLNDNKIKCNQCSIKHRGYSHRIEFNNVVESFINANLTPLFDKYDSCYDKLLCKDEFGYYGLLSYAKLKNGSKFDIVSKYNPYSINNIKQHILINNLRCKIISSIYKSANAKLEFMCECGNVYKTPWRSFMTNHNDRCPTCSKKQSKYARILEDYLIHLNYSYDKEYKYNDCKDINMLSFDFIVFGDNKNILIEVDGETHFIPAWNGIQGLQKQQKRDRIKDEYCKNHNIKLIRISYKEINNGTYINILQKELTNKIG